MSEVQEKIIATDHELVACLEHIARCSCFGFDTEFVGERTYHPRLCLVQVATPEANYLIDPLTTGPLDEFWKLVIDPSRTVVVHAAREEIRLCQLWGGASPSKLFDLQIAAGLAGLSYPLGHGNLVQAVLDVQLPKGETLTEWRHRPLTQAQIQYAFDDVRYLLPLWRNLSAKLEEKGRCAWLDEEVQRLTVQATPEEPNKGERWRKLRGISHLSRRQLAAVRALFYWREEEAEEANRPARTIVRDDLLVEIAKRNPKRERELTVVRGLPRRNLGSILRVIEDVRALPVEECPPTIEREQEPPRLNWLSGVLSAVLGDYCVSEGMAQNLVASNQDVRNLVRYHLGMRTTLDASILTQGWRAQHILPELMAVLEGRRSLRIRDIQAEPLFELLDGEA